MPFTQRQMVLAAVSLVALAGLALLLILLTRGDGGGRAYNGTAAVGDFWRVVVDKGTSTLTAENVTAGADPVTLRYVKNEDDSYDIVDDAGAPRADYVRFIELPNYLLLLQTTRAGPNSDQTAVVIAVKSETLRVTMADNPHLYYQFQRRRGGGSAGFVTFLKGRNASGEPAQWAEGAAPGDVDAMMGRVQPGSMDSFAYNVATDVADAFHAYTQEGEMAMPIDFAEPIANPAPFMTMTETRGDGRTAVNTIYGTSAGQFVVDTPSSSILCFDATRTTTDLSTAVGTYTLLLEGRTGARMSQEEGHWDEEVGGTDITGKGRLVLAATPGGYTVRLNGGDTLPVTTWMSEFGDHFKWSAMTPRPSLDGMFVASSGGSRGVDGRVNMTFSFLGDTVMVQWFRMGAAPTGANAGNPWASSYSYAYGAGVKDVA